MDNADVNGLQIVITELKHGISRRDLLINELRASNEANSSCYIGLLEKADAEISELKAALIKTTDENLELVEKCEKLKKEFAYNEGINRLRRTHVLAMNKHNKSLRLEILDLNKQIGEMRVKLANTVTKMKGEPK